MVGVRGHVLAVTQVSRRRRLTDESIKPWAHPGSDAVNPDGRIVAWVGAIDGARHPVVGDAIGPGDDAVKDPIFLDDKTVLFRGARKNQIMRVTASFG
jgi:hypothetical protein